MRLRMRIDDILFNLLGDREITKIKHFEKIIFENKLTGDKKSFHIDDIYEVGSNTGKKYLIMISQGSQGAN